MCREPRISGVDLRVLDTLLPPSDAQVPLHPQGTTKNEPSNSKRPCLRIRRKAHPSMPTWKRRNIYWRNLNLCSTNTGHKDKVCVLERLWWTILWKAVPKTRYDNKNFVNLFKSLLVFQDDSLKRVSRAKVFKLDRTGAKIFHRDVIYYIFSSGVIVCYVDETKSRGKGHPLVIHEVLPFSDMQIDGEGKNHSLSDFF